MVEGITGIWIFQGQRSIIFSHEFFVQGSQEYNAALFHGLIITLQQFFQEFGEKQADLIEMGNSKIFLSFNEDTGFYFAIRTISTVKDKKIFKFLSQIQDFFTSEITPYLAKFSAENLEIYIRNLFGNYLEKVLGTPLQQNLKNFLGTF
ncbi:MAG: hypothetical protein ACTSQI_06800 [Candidatus Helarchaeota archaeon]